MGFRHCQVIIIDDDPTRREAFAAAVARAGFRAIDTFRATDAAMILMAPGKAVALEQKPDVPILVYGLGDEAGVPPYANGCLPPPDDPRFVVCLSAWVPPSTATVERLAIVFGEAEAAHLAKRLHERLMSVVQQGLPGPYDCHQLAGFAGTLGFSGLHVGLQRLAEGDATAAPAVLHQAQMAVAAIEGLPLFSAKH